MAQKTEKEETEFKSVPETITPCINNCDQNITPCFATSSSTSLIEQQKMRSPRSTSLTSSPIPQLVTPPKRNRDLFEMNGGDSNEGLPIKKAVNRCSGCRKKVGLTGFRCRCGELFCGDHRYSDRHGCSFDYKAAGREAIAKENPVVKADKVVKI